MTEWQIDGDDKFTVQYVGPCSVVNGKTLTWKISWQGYPAAHDTNEPLENLCGRWVLQCALTKLLEAQQRRIACSCTLCTIDRSVLYDGYCAIKNKLGDPVG